MCLAVPLFRGARPAEVLVGGNCPGGGARRVFVRAYREHRGGDRHRAEAGAAAAIGRRRAACRTDRAAQQAGRGAAGEALRSSAAEARDRHGPRDAREHLDTDARALVAARRARRDRPGESAALLPVPAHQRRYERNAGLRPRRQVHGRADLRDREGARAPRQRRPERVHRQYRGGGSEPGNHADAAESAGSAGASGQLGEAALPEPVRDCQGDRVLGAQRPLAARDAGAHRSVVQERCVERVQAVLDRPRLALREDRHPERRRDPPHQRLRDEQPRQGAGDLSEAARRQPHRGGDRAAGRDTPQFVFHRIRKAMRTTALVFVAAIAAQPLRAQPAPPNPPEGAPSATPAPPRPGVRVPNQPGSGAQAPARAQPVAPPATNRPAIAPNRTITPQRPPQTRPTEPTPVEPIDSKEAARRSTGVMMNFDRRDLVEVIQFVSNYTGRNFILPERVSGKITILSNRPIPPDEVWNVFVAALDANNWAVYPIGHYWKLSEKKQSARANIPTYLEPGQEAPAIEQMVTRLFKLRYVEADQMRNTLNQFTSRDSDFQIFPPDTLIISDLGLNMRRLERLIEQLDQPGGSEEIHIVQVQYASAQALQQKLQEIFTQQGRPGVSRALGIAEVQPQPGQPPPAAAAAQL